MDLKTYQKTDSVVSAFTIMASKQYPCWYETLFFACFFYYIIVAAGTSDFKCRIFSTYIREIEEKPGPTSWGKRMSFGQLMGEYGRGIGGWVHGVSFNAEGDKLAFVSHDSSVAYITAGMEQEMF